MNNSLSVKSFCSNIIFKFNYTQLLTFKQISAGNISNGKTQAHSNYILFPLETMSPRAETGLSVKIATSYGLATTFPGAWTFPNLTSESSIS